MRKIIPVFLSALIFFSFSTTSFASTNIENSLSESANTVAIIWNDALNSKALYVNEDNKLSLEYDSTREGDKDYNDFVRLVELCNYCLDNDILKIDSYTGQLSSTINFDQEYIPYGKLEKIHVSNHNTIISPQNYIHGCSIPELNMLAMCRNNYNTIESFYDDMVILQGTHPEIDPFSSTVSYWVGKVRPNGSWDYKSVPGYAPASKTFCAYYDGTFNHITSEYFGNFNYGYTGSFLFPLSTLYRGSTVVAGSIDKDQHDWPAISAGYYHA